MEMQIKATDQITTIGGVQCRVWEGTTPGGIPCTLFIHRIAVRRDADTSEFDRELQEQLPPARVVSLAHIL